MPAPAKARESELPALTGLRGFAAFWVLVYHLWVDAVPRRMTIGFGDFTLDFTPAFSCGWAGVDIFFTLSAFLLTLPFASWQLGAASRPSLGTFWLRRVLRIVPAYYAQLAVLLVLAGFFGVGAWPTLRQFLGNLALWTNFGPFGAAPMNPVTYTLPIEFCFYLLLPILALLLKPRQWALLALLAIVVTQVYRRLMFAEVAHADVPLRVIALEQMPGRLDQFVLGMLAAYAYTRAAIRDRLPSVRCNDALFVAGAIGLALMTLWIHLAIGTYWDGATLLFIWHGLAGVAVATMLFAGAAGSRIADALFANRALRHLGIVSLGLYLWHFPLIQWLDAAHAFAWINGYRLPWTLPIVLILSLIAANLSYRLVERPWMRIGRRRARDPGVATELVHAPPHEGAAARA